MSHELHRQEDMTPNLSGQRMTGFEQQTDYPNGNALPIRKQENGCVTKNIGDNEQTSVRNNPNLTIVQLPCAQQSEFIELEFFD